MTLNPITDHDALPNFSAGAPLQDSFLAQTLIALVAIAAVIGIMIVNGFLLGPAPRVQQTPGHSQSVAPRSAAAADPAAMAGKSGAATPCRACARVV
jgi:hypothetical protein